MRDAIIEVVGFKLVIERLRTRSHLLLCRHEAEDVGGRARALMAPSGQVEVLEDLKSFRSWQRL